MSDGVTGGIPEHPVHAAKRELVSAQEHLRVRTSCGWRQASHSTRIGSATACPSARYTSGWLDDHERRDHRGTGHLRRSQRVDARPRVSG